MNKNKETRNSAQQSRQAGFTLVEVMIAVLVFSLGLMAMAGMQTRSVQQATFSDQMTNRVNALMHWSEALTRTPIMDETVGLDGGVDITVTTGDAFKEANMCEYGTPCDSDGGDYCDDGWDEVGYKDKSPHTLCQRVTQGYPLPNLVMIETEAVPQGISGAETIQRRTVRSSYVRSKRWN